MKIFNTLTRRKDEFVPLEEGKVRMYVCGPTVYNYIHIGNARPMIVFDTVRRYFEYKGYDVNYVSNFTDVDDKIIKKANEEGVDASVISERFIKEAQKDMADMNVKEATYHPKATEEIDGMIDMIQTLIDKGHAYPVDGTVYFRTRSFKDYGKLSKKNIDDLEAGHREIKVNGEEGKEDPLDFVLWKPKKEGEPSWPSPWGDGRPGWHIECSVMSKKYLGEQIDIHAGGEDLIFPHHENEIAQSEACNDKEFAHYWMHNGFLNINNVKMSKSLGNFFTVREIAEKYDLQVLRFFMLSAHYRSPLNFSAELMEASRNGLERILTAIDRLRTLNLQGDTCTEEENEQIKSFDALVAKYEAAMEDDFNTADAISAIFEMVKAANIHVTENSTAAFRDQVLSEIIKLCDVLGIKTEKKEELLDDEIQTLIDERQAARKAKNFARADEIRDELLAKGIILKDTREGVKWSRA
ncbi:cysteine--tRNA ligase [Coprococcus catus]|uniref:cysteine--tRNA ligase n=1 Tax=Coprococcus catus TaxID=116085 RepID=UPI0015B7C709|nr:cysteine--tRNA ligase [Coprococcus catus]MBX9231214.1 cysteine--tRNA ligase [Coprococcus catus]MCT6799472.1 cysteine--tRNA ligase [Coprococcus catus]